MHRIPSQQERELVPIANKGFIELRGQYRSLGSSAIDPSKKNPALPEKPQDLFIKWSLENN